MGGAPDGKWGEGGALFRASSLYGAHTHLLLHFLSSFPL